MPSTPDPRVPSRRGAPAAGHGKAPTPTVEAVWAQYGDALERLVMDALGDDREVVHAVCCRTMVAVAEALVAGPGRRATADLWSLVERVGSVECGLVRDHGLDPAAMRAATPIGAVPHHLRVFLQLRAIREADETALEECGARTESGRMWVAERRRLREAYERWRRGLAAVLLFPRRAWRNRSRQPLAVRGWYERTEALTGPGVAGATPRLAGLVAVAGHGVAEAAAVVTAVALGLGGAASLSEHPAPIPAPQTVSASSPLPEVSKTAPEITTGALEGARTGASTPAATPTSSAAPAAEQPAPVPGIAPPPPPAVEAQTDAATDAPVTTEPYERDYNRESSGTSYETPSTRVAVDVDEDGDPEADVGTPYVFVDCPPPGNRGPVVDATCSGLEASGLGE